MKIVSLNTKVISRVTDKLYVGTIKHQTLGANMLNQYVLTEQDKQDLIDRLTNDISFQDENFEVESDDIDAVVSEEDEQGLF